MPREVVIPGIKGVHCIVRDGCRQRPFEDWMGDVLGRVREELTAMHQNWPKDKDVQFHVVVTLDNPKHRT